MCCVGAAPALYVVVRTGLQETHTQVSVCVCVLLLRGNSNNGEMET